MLKWTGIILGGLLVVLLAAAVIVPPLIDFSAYRAPAVSAVQAATGRTLGLEGPIRLKILPTPSLVVEDVALGNADGTTDQQMVTVASISAELAILPLLSGTIQITELVLDGPDIVLETLADGRNNWTFTPPAAAADNSANSGGMDVRLDQVRIVDGRLRYRDQAAETVTAITAVTLSLAADSLEGPYRADGTFEFDGRETDVTLETRRRRDGSALPFTLGFEVGDAVSGTVAGNANPAGSFDGSLTLETGSMSSLLALLPPGLAPALAVDESAAIRTELTASATGFSAQDLSLTLGENTITGRISAALTEQGVDLTAALAADNLALEELVEAIELDDAEDTTTTGDVAAGPLLPPGLTADLALDVDTATAADGTIRQTRLRATIADQVLRIGEAGALLPGGATVQLAGSVDMSASVPTIDTQLEAQADDLPGLLQWLDIEVEGLPEDRLRRLQTQIKLTGAPDRLAVPDLYLEVDNTALTGALELSLGDRCGVGATLRIDTLNLDRYGLTTTEVSEDDAADPAEIRAGLEAGLASAAETLENIDIGANLAVDQLTANGITARDVTIVLQAVGGEAITIKTLSATLGSGLGVDLSGTVSALSPLAIETLTVTTTAQALTGQGVIPAGVDERVLGALTPLAVTTTVAGGLDALDAEVDGQLGNTRLGWDGTVDDPLAAVPSLRGQLSLATPALRDWLTAFDPLAWPAAAAPGATDFAATVNSSDDSISLSDLDGTIDGTSVAGKLSYDLEGDALDADLALGTLYVDYWTPLASGAEPAEATAALPATQANAALTVARLLSSGYELSDVEMTLNSAADGATVIGSATAYGGAVTFDLGATPGAGGLDYTAKATTDGLAIANAMTGMQLDGFISGALASNIDLTASGADQSAITRSLSGLVDFTLSEGQLAGFDLEQVAQALLAFNNRQQPQPASLHAITAAATSGGTAFELMKGKLTFDEGTMSTDAIDLVTPIANGTMALTADLATYLMSGAGSITLREDFGVPAIGFSADGRLDAPGMRLDTQSLFDLLASDAATQLLSDNLPAPVRGLVDQLPLGGSTPVPAGDTSTAEPTPSAPASPLPPPGNAGNTVRGFFDAITR